MNPLDFFFNGAQQQQGSWFAPVTQGVSTFSSGVNPAALEAAVDFGGDVFQYNQINAQTLGSLMGIFGNVSNTVAQILNYVAMAAQYFAASGG